METHGCLLLLRISLFQLILDLASKGFCVVSLCHLALQRLVVLGVNFAGSLLCLFDIL